MIGFKFTLGLKPVFIEKIFQFTDNIDLLFFNVKQRDIGNEFFPFSFYVSCYLIIIRGNI